MNQKPLCPKINLNTFCLALVFTALLMGLLGCKSNFMLSADGLEEVDTLAVEEEIFWEPADELPYQPAATRSMDLVHMKLQLKFDWKSQQVKGMAQLLLTPYFYPQKTVVLDAQDFELEWVGISKGSDYMEWLPYRYNGQELEVDLPKELAPGDTVELVIEYVAFPEKNSGEGSAAITDTKGLYFIDPMDTIPGKPTMLWTQGETQHSSKWFPTIDQPNERLTHDIWLTVPDSMVSISNGRLIQQESLENGLRRDYWKMDLPHAPYLVVIAVGDFAKVTSSHGDLPLGYYVEKGYEKGAEKVFARTPQMIGYFEKILGVPFPWQKYDQIVVRDFVSGAMENTTASIFMEELLLDEREALDSEWDYIIAHELFHQWFGDLVTAESWSNLTLNEAFANYSEYLWNAHYYGEDQAALKLVTEREGYFAEAEQKQEPLIRFQYGDAEEMFDAHSYNKGGLVLHLLRRHLGDAAFFKGLNLYLTRHAFQSVEAHDLRLAFELVSGQDLNWFFNQWFFAKGHPELEIEVDYSQPENLLLSINQVQDSFDIPVFQLPVELSWYEGALRKTKTILFTETRQQVALDNGQAIDQLYVDEGLELLAKKNQVLSNAHYGRQFKESHLGVARYQALDSLIAREAAVELVEVLPAALEDSFWSVREQALLFLQSSALGQDSLASLEGRVYALAEGDPHNSVRAAAIDLLAAWNPSAYQGAFIRLSRDPSYLVAGAALMGLVLGREPKISLAVVESFEKESNYRMRIPVAEFYIKERVKGKGPWFEQSMDTLRGEGLYYFIGYYASYFGELPEEGRDETVSRLLSLLATGTKDYIRLGAFQALLGFVDVAGVLEKITLASEVEPSKELQGYFGYFLEMLKEEN
jgi:aminopeptidase N